MYSTYLTSNNIYPLNLWVGVVGGVMWVMLGIMWKRTSLALLNGILLFITVDGLVELYAGAGVLQ